MFYFMKHIYSDSTAKLQSTKVAHISAHSFSKMEKICTKVLSELKAKNAKKEGKPDKEKKYRATKFLQLVNRHLHIPQCF